jgi:hypothetical protein
LGSPGLGEFAAVHKNRLKADVLIGSDGPRLSPERPTLFMGSRGLFNFKMSLNPRDGGHHSGNWGGLLANPGIILSHAIFSMITKDGKVLVEGIRLRDQSLTLFATIYLIYMSMAVNGGLRSTMILANRISLQVRRVLVGTPLKFCRLLRATRIIQSMLCRPVLKLCAIYGLFRRLMPQSLLQLSVSTLIITDFRLLSWKQHAM